MVSGVGWGRRELLRVTDPRSGVVVVAEAEVVFLVVLGFVNVGVDDGEAKFEAEFGVGGIFHWTEADGGAGFGFQAAGFLERGKNAGEKEFGVVFRAGQLVLDELAVDAGFVIGEVKAEDAEFVKEFVALLFGCEADVVVVLRADGPFDFASGIRADVGEVFGFGFGGGMRVCG